MNEEKFNYEPKKVETIAGAINSVHDLMGMIIADVNIESSDISTLSDEYIYYDENTRKFYRKHLTYSFDGQEYDQVDLKEWTGEYFYKDTSRLGNSAYPDYIKDTEFYNDREYNTFDKIGLQHTDFGSVYEPNTYYIRSDYSWSSLGNMKTKGYLLSTANVMVRHIIN